MTADLLALLWAPFLMCLVLTGIHAYLGIHVIAREVVFVDIAMAQIAALGATAAFLFGFELESMVSYATALGFTVLGAGVLALTRTRERHVSQEAIIGVVYAVSAAAAVLLADRAPHGAEHIRAMLVGSLLSVAPEHVAKVAALYAVVGAVHWALRRPFLMISTDPDAAYRQGWRVRVWDFVFYATFGVVVTSSVRVAGVLLVFSYLIVPALAGIMLGGGITARLLTGWAFGTAVSVLGIAASAALDLPTGATVVCAFGAMLLALALAQLMRTGRSRSVSASSRIRCRRAGAREANGCR
jgi:zinc/manganese transport system permease protein